MESLETKMADPIPNRRQQGLLLIVLVIPIRATNPLMRTSEQPSYNQPRPSSAKIFNCNNHKQKRKQTVMEEKRKRTWKISLMVDGGNPQTATSPIEEFAGEERL